MAQKIWAGQRFQVALGGQRFQLVVGVERVVPDVQLGQLGLERVVDLVVELELAAPSVSTSTTSVAQSVVVLDVQLGLVVWLQ